MYITDTRQIPPYDRALPRFIIVGAGAIGLFAASELASRGFETVVVEAGDSQLGNFGSDSYKSIGHHHAGIRLGRGRNLGGTTTLWGGQLVEFMPIDFAGRDWLPHSKWPVTYEEISPYYGPAYRKLGVPAKIVDDKAVWRGINASQPDLGPDLEVFFTRWMGTPNFAELFEDEIQTDRNLIVLTGHTVVAFRGDSAHIDAVRVVDKQGGFQWIEGSAFVLAAGTIENARLLLHAAQDPDWDAPWRGNDNVGRYFQDHLGGSLGSVRPADRRTFFNLFANVVYQKNKFQPKIRIKNANLAVTPVFNVQGMLAFENEFSEHMVFLKQFLRAAFYSRKLTGLGEVIRKGSGIFRFLVPLMWKYVWDHRIFVPSTSKTKLICQAEHAPCRDSRIMVDRSVKDAYGLPQVVLDWRVRGDEGESIRNFALRLQEAFRVAGFGELEIEKDLLELNPAFLAAMGDTYHQSGGAIMAASANEGVVDKNLRVFGTENLYVGGASVFPTNSNANVTFTALAFTMRLVDHLTGVSSLSAVSTPPVELSKAI